MCVSLTRIESMLLRACRNEALRLTQICVFFGIHCLLLIQPAASRRAVIEICVVEFSFLKQKDRYFDEFVQVYC